MIKNYILDTNVLLHDPQSLLCFQENNVLIPIEVIEEIDRFKRESSERGQNARAVSRVLDELRGQGRLSEGVALPAGGKLRILLHGSSARLPVTFNGTTVDDRLIALTRDIQEADSGVPTVLVTKDINLRIKADAVGLQAQDYETDHVHIQDLYTGSFELTTDPEALNAFRATRELPLNGAGPRFPNEYCTLADASNGKRTALARVDATGERLRPLLDHRDGVWGIRARNREQHFAFDALLDEQVRLVTLMGKAGTGKTLLALAAGLRKTVQEREYRRLLVARPTLPMGRELGYLPGSLEEKLEPWMQPIYDALDMLSDLNTGREERRPAELIHSGIIAIEALSYIRGRNIANQFIVIDEAQNLTPLEVKTIITRVGHGTKIVLTGDPYQIDNPYVDSSSNGFNYVASKFRSHPIAAHIELQKGERSELAEVAANIL
ncbi:MAG TPA: PhoH family protein [Candidatus Acidoferrum sp.]|nr:PhoH family protein [Candidatus Acidoferrum sp.]